MSLKADAKLTLKKCREETGLFIVEGRKGIEELLASPLIVLRIYVTLEESARIDRLAHAYAKRTGNPLPEVIIVSISTLTTHGTMESNTVGLAVGKIPEPLSNDVLIHIGEEHHVLVLDDIQDPGNLGTIVRTADWFGITHIVASPTTVDVWNPKVIRASMGSFTRVTVHYTPLLPLLKHARTMRIPSYGTFLHGENIYTTTFEKRGLIVMGSESHGVKDTYIPHIEKQVTIPRRGNAESLNVGVATALILSEATR